MNSATNFEWLFLCILHYCKMLLPEFRSGVSGVYDCTFDVQELLHQFSEYLDHCISLYREIIARARHFCMKNGKLAKHLGNRRIQKILTVLPFFT